MSLSEKDKKKCAVLRGEITKLRKEEDALVAEQSRYMVAAMQTPEYQAYLAKQSEVSDCRQKQQRLKIDIGVIQDQSDADDRENAIVSAKASGMPSHIAQSTYSKGRRACVR